MKHNVKTRAMIHDLEAKGIGPWSSAPPLYRGLWRLGLELTPPYFQSFGAIFAVNALGFAIVWGAIMVPLFHDRVWNVSVQAVGIGALFGLFMAIRIRGRARRLKLPVWHEYDPMRSPSAPPR